MKNDIENAEAGSGEYLDKPEILESSGLYGYVEQYKKAFEKLIELEGTQYAKRVEAGNAAENVWTVRKAAEAQRKECPKCMVAYKHEIHQSYADFSEYMHTELTKALGEVEQINEEATSSGYDTYLKRSHMFYYINNFFVHAWNLAPALDATLQVGAVPLPEHTEGQRAEIAHLRHMLNVLFYHCRTPALSIARSNLLTVDFNKDVQDLLAGLGGVLLRIATYSDHLFLLRHCLACPALAPALVQLPGPVATWTPDTVRFYSKAVGIAADVVLSAEETGPHSLDMVAVLCATADGSGPCFHPLEAPAEDRVIAYVTEEEVNSVFLQLDPQLLTEFLRRTLKSDDPGAEDTIAECRDALESLMKSLCSTLHPIVRKKYLYLGRTVTRTLSVLLTFFARQSTPCISQKVFDDSLIKVTKCILRLGKDDADFLTILSSVLPVEKLSPDEGFWGYLAALHFLDGPGVPELWSHDEWYKYPLRQAPGKTPLDILAGELCTVSGLGQCVSDALMRAGLGFGEDAMLACLIALFQVGFVDARTRGRMLGDCTMAIAGICAECPAQISNLVRLFACSYAIVPATDCEGLFRALSFVGWSPDPELIREAQGWLVRDFATAATAEESYSTFHTLGKIVFEKAPWSTMSTTHNQYAAYLIAEVMALIKRPAVSPLASAPVVKEILSLPRRVRDEFMCWCWNVLLHFNYNIDPENNMGEGEPAAVKEEVEDIEENFDDFVVVKKNTSSFKVLVPENENENDYMEEISSIIDPAISKGLDPLKVFVGFVLTECGSQWKGWTSPPYKAIRVLELCSDEQMIFKILTWACTSFAAAGALYQMLTVRFREFVATNLIASGVTTVERFIEDVVEATIISDTSPSQGFGYADFWIHFALEGSRGDPPVTGRQRVCEDTLCQDIISGVLRIWFIHRSKEIPFIQLQPVALSLATEAGFPNDGSASIIPFDPYSPADPIPIGLSSSSLYAIFTSMKSWISPATTQHLLATPFFAFEVLYIETRGILGAEKVHARILTGKMRQWLNYTLNLGQECEILTLFTQATLYLYLRCLFDPENTGNKKSFSFLL